MPPWPQVSILPRLLLPSFPNRLPELEKKNSEQDLDFLRRRLREYHHQAYVSSGTMASYILPEGRRLNSLQNRSFGADRVLTISDRDTRRASIAWRANLLGVRRRCPICKGQFNRRHVADCNLLGDMNLGNAQQVFLQHLSRYPHLVDKRKCYNIVDALLNSPELHHHLPAVFERLFHLLEPIANASTPNPPSRPPSKQQHQDINNNDAV
jgi:hypothetical protein